jgi:uncharacterized protein YoxC
MSPEDEKTALTLFKYIRDDVKGAVAKVDALGNKVDEVKDAVTKLKGQAVTKVACDDHHKQVNERLFGISRELKNKQTRERNPSIAPLLMTQKEITAVGPAPSNNSLLTKIKDNIAAISVILGFLGILGVGFYKLAHLVVDVERTVKKKNGDHKVLKELKNEIKKLNSQKPVIHYFPAPALPPDTRIRKKRNRRGRQ